MNTIVKNTVSVIFYVCAAVLALSLVGVISVSGASVRVVVGSAACDMFRSSLMVAAAASAVGCFITGRIAQ